MNAHNEAILAEYRENKETFEKMKEIVLEELRKVLQENGLLVTVVEARVKEEKSLAGKLELKGYKYKDLEAITDILGSRVVVFYNNQVDKVASMIEKSFNVDWENSIDKRKILEKDQFGYLSLHYICTIPESLYKDPECPNINKYKFEVQLRTALQHVWATAHHDTGYKSDIEIPIEYIRSINRLAGLLEIADNEFSKVLSDITEYRRKVSSVIKDGNYSDLPLNGDTFKSYMEIKPFDALNKKIASINNAEIQEQSFHPYFKIFKDFELSTIGDIEKIKNTYSDDAFRLASLQLAETDLDIIAETVGLQHLCEVFIIKNGGGEIVLKFFYDNLYGTNERNARTAKRVYAQATSINILPERDWV